MLVRSECLRLNIWTQSSMLFPHHGVWDPMAEKLELRILPNPRRHSPAAT